jgi:hypothetical protein
MDDHDDFAFEPIRGLPAELPRDERLIWQGAPDWRLLAIEAFHLRKVAIYFAIVAAWQWSSAMADGASFLEAGAGLRALGLSAAGSLSILAGLAWLYARTTVYTLTSRRIVTRSGLALPVTLNLPLSLIENAALARNGKGGGIAFEVKKPNRVAWLVAWPSARPWRFNHPQPMFRALRDPVAVAELVAGALSQTAGASRATPVRVTRAPGKTVNGLAPDAGHLA